MPAWVWAVTWCVALVVLVGCATVLVVTDHVAALWVLPSTAGAVAGIVVGAMHTIGPQSGGGGQDGDCDR